MPLHLGLRIKTHLGNFHERALHDILFGNLDADKSITAILEHDHSLNTRPSRGRPPEVGYFLTFSSFVQIPLHHFTVGPDSTVF